MSHHQTIPFYSEALDHQPLLPNIKHECLHVLEHHDEGWKKSDYDVSKLDACIENFKDFLVVAVDCFNKDRVEGCDKVYELALYYQHRPVLLPTDTIPEGENRSSRLLTLYLKDEIVFKINDDGRMSILRPYLRIEESGRKSAPSKRDIRVINMLGTLDSFNDIRQKIADEYTREEFPAEYNAAVVGRNPERALNSLCPGDFRRSEEARRNAKQKREL